MENLDEKLKRYRESIPYKEVQEAFKVFYETRDEKIRENLILRYMPALENKALILETELVEREDILQDLYEILIKAIDRYNPNNKSLFSRYLNTCIERYIETIKSKKNPNVSLTNLEIIANDNVEEKIINKMYKEYIFGLINDYLNNSPSKRYSNIFKKIYGINCTDYSENIAKLEGVKHQFISAIKVKILIEIYLMLVKEDKYYPSEFIYQLLTNYNVGIVSSLSKAKKDTIYNLDFTTMEYFPFYYSCDSLEDSHDEYIRKLK